MSYRKLRLNLTAVGFPLLSEFSGRTIVIPLLDENDQTSVNTGLVQANPEKRNAAMYYAENVMPTAQGLQTVNYINAVPAIAGKQFTQMFEVRDALRNVTYLGITTSGTVYIRSLSTKAWVAMTTPSWTTSLQPSIAIVITSSGVVSLLCLPGAGIYTVDCVANTLTATTLSGSITASTVLGICAASNYLILHNGNYVYWSSAFDPLDFNLTNALVSGTGFGIPTGMTGSIVGLLSGNSGFGIGTTGNAVLASLNSGNTLYPWTFTVVPNSSGMQSARSVTSAPDGSLYQWGSAGLVRLAPNGSVMEYPEVTDFLAGRLIEAYDASTGQLTSTKLSFDMSVLIKMLGHRYLVISYGASTAYYEYALVLDTALGRWGKLKVDHTDTGDFNLATQAATFGATYNGVGLLTYNANPSVNTYTNLVSVVSKVGAPKRTLGFLGVLGDVNLLTFDVGDTVCPGVAIIGKLALDRQNLAKLLEVQLDNVEQVDSNFSLQIGTSYDGKNISYPLSTPFLSNVGNKTRDYLCNYTGQSHSLFLQGSFNLNSVIVTMMDNGSF